jgi:hypothetical protein
MDRAIKLLFLLLLIFPAVGYCDDDHAADPTPACSGAVEWTKSHPTRSFEEMKHADEARKFTDVGLRRELQERAEADQRARRAFLAAPMPLADYTCLMQEKARTGSSPQSYIIQW